MNYNELAKEIHQNAVEHGWWDEERSDGECFALMHSELSEALEELRNGHKVNEIYYHDKKPEGVPIELADVVIRILDWAEHKGLDIERNGEESKGIYRNSEKSDALIDGDFINHMHGLLSQAFMDRNFGGTGEVHLRRVITMIEEHLAAHGIHLYDVILIKMAYNKTRPYKHGGKRF